MRLVWIRVRGYRRFFEPQTLRFTGKLTALVGRNEAGKTSLLQLLSHLASDEPFARLDGTKGEEPASQPTLEAGFFLDSHDRAALEEIPKGETVRWFKITKTSQGSREFSIEPSLHRDLGPRKLALRTLKKAMVHPLLEPLLEAGAEGEPDPLVGASELLATATENLPPGSLSVLNTAITALESEDELLKEGPAYVSVLANTLRRVAEIEAYTHPAEDAVAQLVGLVPTFALFSQESRDLKSSYDIQEASTATPQALANLASVASLDLVRLLRAVENQDQADVSTIQDAANRKLADTLEAGWSQSGIKVAFRADGMTLHIQIRDEDNRFSGLDERSDGLRQFVALLAFCTSQRVQNPNLLIDEAETHLHYDAQADLIEMLATQELARQVVYTTHSTGCLPEDLGSGIRIIEPHADRPTRSRINNTFWQDDVGLMPLLFGMGATTLAFLSVRVALLVEGPSDAILLPHLFRDASKGDNVGFQIVPGLSKASRAQIPVLTSHGSSVLYLVDNDDGGGNQEKWLRKLGVDRNDIFRLAPRTSTLTSPEDALDTQLFVDAVNQYLEKWAPTTPRLEAKDVPSSRRSQALGRWLKQQGLETPSKVQLAYEVVEELLDDPDRRVVAASRAKGLKRLLGELTARFDDLKGAVRRG